MLKKFLLLSGLFVSIAHADLLKFEVESGSEDERVFCSQIAGQAYLCGIQESYDEKKLKAVQLRYVLNGEIKSEGYYLHAIKIKHLNEACERLGFKGYERASTSSKMALRGSLEAYSSRKIERRFSTYSEFIAKASTRKVGSVIREFSCR